MGKVAIIFYTVVGSISTSNFRIGFYYTNQFIITFAGIWYM